MALVDGTNCGFVSARPVDDPVGGSVLTQDTYARASKFTSPADATGITEVGWWCDTASQAANYQVGIYSHDAVNNRPGDLLAMTEAAKGTTAGWKYASVIYSISPSTIYWLAVQLDDTATTTQIDYNSATGMRNAKSGLTELPAPWPVVGSSTGMLAIYAVYETEAPAGTNMSINIGDAWKDVTAIQINIGDVWKDVTKAEVNIGDVWKTIFSA